MTTKPRIWNAYFLPDAEQLDSVHFVESVLVTAVVEQLWNPQALKEFGERPSTEEADHLGVHLWKEESDYELICSAAEVFPSEVLVHVAASEVEPDSLLCLLLASA